MAGKVDPMAFAQNLLISLSDMHAPAETLRKLSKRKIALLEKAHLPLMCRSSQPELQSFCYTIRFVKWLTGRVARNAVAFMEVCIG
ncbi:MAG TPA: hypothetical protein VH024_08580 [Candidatus Angelobacter sp.]|jgi:hypothetical protein|nr:hypothetical protein [Candidatus Angelobacter sp.]